MKRCTKCDEEKDLSCFDRDYRRSTLRAICRKCTSAYRREWQRNRNLSPTRRAKQADAHLRRNYGLTYDEYVQIHQDQGGRCAICGRPEDANRRLAVDHCHRTGAIRGLLCTQCNVALGYFQDEPDRLYEAVNYLLRVS